MSKRFSLSNNARLLSVGATITLVAIASALFVSRKQHTAQVSAPASLSTIGRVQANIASLPLVFEQNRGQTDAQVRYMARGDGYTLFLTERDAVFSLRHTPARQRTNFVKKSREPEAQTAVVRMELTGAKLASSVAASDVVPGKSNYFIGNDRSKWQTGVAHYARVNYRGVYPGVDLAFHGAQRQTEFDFVVAPNADATPIAFHFTGAQAIKSDDSGNLQISSSAGNVVLHKPFAYQNGANGREPVDARFVLADNKISFALGNYDHSRELVIDPSVAYAYSTFLGGSGDDEGQAIAFDGSGNAYVTGETASADFPGHTSTNKLNGASNVFVSELSANGATLVYSDYVGGSGSDAGNAIAVDSSGNAYVGGGTSSPDFPHTTSASLTGSSNAFVFKLNAGGGTPPSYSTYLGGTGDDTVLGIALAKSSSDVFVVGKTSSTDFPLFPVASPLQGLVSGSTSSGFVTRLTPSGASLTLVYSTYIGGSSDGDLASGVGVDGSNNAYVAGQTFNSSFHATGGVVQPTCGSCSNGNSNAFVTAINPSGSNYVYSTFLGGSGHDAGDGIAVDSSGNAYVTGATESSDFPIATNAFQAGYGGGTDAFLSKLNPQGTALIYSTFLGGSGFDAGANVAIDSSGNAYITGQTNSSGTSGFPVTSSALQSSLKGGYDAFVTELNSSGSQLVFSTYLGGSDDEDDGGNYGAIAVSGTGGTIYVTGNTASSDFPTSSPYQSANGGGNDAFVTVYSQPLTPTFTLGATTPAAVAPGTSATSTVTLTADNGYSSAVNLTCSVTGTGSPLPACSAASSFSTNPVTPTAAGATTTLTITTTGPSAALARPRGLFYAMWLPIAGISLAGFGLGSSRRRKVFGLTMVLSVLALLMILPACGGGSSNNGGGGGGGGGTTAGAYTVTITGTGTDANTTTQSTTVTLTVN